MYSIIGSGFGLYGYLPAIVKLHKKDVVLPKEYREKILSRPELKEFDKDIVWVESKDEALKKTTNLIIAVPPYIQYRAVREIVKKAKIKTVYMEKPVAPTPEMSIDLLNFLDLNKVNYVVGYSFLYIGLQDRFEVLSNTKQDIFWKWTFMAHHFLMNLNNWKRYHDVGGGVLRFYGIHVVALLSMLGYDEVINSTLIADDVNEPYIWKASITGFGLPVCHIEVNCKSDQDIFKVSNEKLGAVILVKDPFDLTTQESGQLDRRVATITKELSVDFFTQDDLKSVYKSVNKLWKQIEGSTKSV